MEWTGKNACPTVLMIVNRQRRIRVSLRRLEQFVGRAQRTLGLPPGQELTVCLVSDREMARLNRSFRGRRGPTDVLSFPMCASSAFSTSSTSFTSFVSCPSYLGDIAISAETAHRNARRVGRRPVDELCILVLHGILHLLGHDHETDGGQMNRLERRLRRRLSLG